MIRPTTCPICQHVAPQASVNTYFPFCSERCKLVDFSRWWDGKYQIVDHLDEDRLLELQERTDSNSQHDSGDAEEY
ncbi:protein of unknown function DUF329 [Planctopirus limnophila DSM 3776]|uniref:DNA gyrase inhibitor YacG n=1 Tax=Planctopirus limnophila (strain ATCC 43296 / DSM 3776 / IFAM 1008 / Mu 290) TaxID=521674 RepID=D5SUE4_PLAL2|nr:DNA gyrase inhibitor YacG [Planctopirus limnophila]ADG69197.1 protein of unknown function DUF329 [Planctopirus limnophila DSM 3776]